MNTVICETTPSVSPLEHDLRPHFAALARFESTSALEASELYQRLRPEIDGLLNGVACEDFTTPRRSTDFSSAERAVRATAWNIERGSRLEGIIEVLRVHPSLAESDVLFLTELDYGMARSGNRHVAREIAGALKMSYAFAPCYVNLAKGSGLESEAEGENQAALHGNAVLARYPLARAHSIVLPNGKDKMRGKEKRLGSQRAVVADVEHPAGAFRAVSLHLDAHSSQRHRWRQMKLVLDHLEQLEPRLPVLIGGDWNTTTYNSSRAVYTIFGFFRRLLMGVRNILQNHYVHPERWFERGLFREIERRGYGFRELNEPGAGTLHYDVKDLAANTNMADWVPGWCFWWLNWALKDNGGRCSLKLDWFAGRGITPVPSLPPRVVGNLRDRNGGVLSDHDAIVLDFFPR